MSAEILQRLIDAGMSHDAANAKADLFDQAEQCLRAMRNRPTVFQRFYVPGRIEILGKHTDYAGGSSLLCAAERGICMAVSSRDDETIRISDFIGKRDAELRLGFHDATTSRWLGYVTAVMRRITRNFPGKLYGANIAFGSDLPRAAGMSSSSALLISIFTALASVNHLSEHAEYRNNIRSREDLATYLACIENGQSFGTLTGDSGVGTHGGSEDHIAILCCSANTLSNYIFCPARRLRDITFGDDLEFVIAVSGIAADKTGTAKEAYNRASRAARIVLEIWRASSGRDDATLFAALTSSPDAAQQIRETMKHSVHGEFSSQLLLDRVEQFREETIEIIPSAIAALENRNWKEFGELVDRSQTAAEMLLKNQIPETISLARSARKLGAIAASSFGAGFGGSVWSLVPSANAKEFAAAWEESYRSEFPAAAEAGNFFSTRPGPSMLAL